MQIVASGSAMWQIVVVAGEQVIDELTEGSVS